MIWTQAAFECENSCGAVIHKGDETFWVNKKLMCRKCSVETEIASGTITVDTRTYDAKLNDSYELGKIFSHLVHQMKVKEPTLEGETAHEFVIRQFKQEMQKFAEWLVAQRFIDGTEYIRHYDLLFIDEKDLPRWLIEGFERERHA